MIETRFINGLIALFKFSRNTQTQKPADNSHSRSNRNELFARSIHVLFYMLSVQRIPSETHLRQAAEFVFFFLNDQHALFLHDHLIYHTFSHCQVEFRIFFRFFLTCIIRKTFLRRASCFIALSKCSFKNSSRF